eukprot:COSAG01_NODE_9807_length_2339_cov_1.695089_2_plen_207_part_00
MLVTCQIPRRLLTPVVATQNGSIMRVGPIGLLAWRSPSSQASWANGVLSSHVTHQARLCKEGCAALGVAIAAALQAKAAGAEPVEAVLSHLDGITPYTDYTGMLRSMLAAAAAAAAASLTEGKEELAQGPEGEGVVAGVAAELQAATDAMHEFSPHSELFSSQGHDGASIAGRGRDLDRLQLVSPIWYQYRSTLTDLSPTYCTGSL